MIVVGVGHLERMIGRSQDQSLDSGRTLMTWNVIIVMRSVNISINVKS